MGKCDFMITNSEPQGPKSGNGHKAVYPFAPLPAQREGVLDQETFHTMLTLRAPPGGTFAPAIRAHAD